MKYKPTCSIYLDTRSAKSNNKFPVKIRLTHMRKSRYYSTGLDFTEEEFTRIWLSKKRIEKDRHIYLSLQKIETKVLETISKIKYFTFIQFENLYTENRSSTDDIFQEFDNYIEYLKKEQRAKSCSSYLCAKNSFFKFNPKLTFADINKSLLMEYERFMLANNISRTTIGIYNRNLRRLFNLAIQENRIEESLSPYKGRNKYNIPHSVNTKKALDKDEILKLFNYKTDYKSPKDRARDFWIFMYLCNGMNVKDMCLLKYKNIENGGKYMQYVREKTKNATSNTTVIRISLKEQTIKIIDKWGQPKVSPETYIFPFVNVYDNPFEIKRKVENVVKLINKQLKKIVLELGLSKDIRTYHSRHSFATALKRAGANPEIIKETMGHTDLKTTNNYLASIEDDSLKNITDSLIDFD